MIDQLVQRIEELKNPTVVGLDPTLSMIPDVLSSELTETFGKTPKAVCEMFVRFNEEIIDAVFDIVPAVKPQIAMYEKFGLDGINAYLRTIEYAKSKGLLVIGDIKRGDISSTAEAYAGHLSGLEVFGKHFDPWKEDAITVNPYFGTDGIAPFVKACDEYDKAIFILVRTSNPSSSEIQNLLTNDQNLPLYVSIGELVKKWGESSIGKSGFSRVGAVVGATHPDEGVLLRKLLPNTFFLVPGYGAQGATAEDLKGFFTRDGRGCIVNSSRGIIAAWKKEKRYEAGLPGMVGEAAREAAITMREDLK